MKQKEERNKVRMRGVKKTERGKENGIDREKRQILQR